MDKKLEQYLNNRDIWNIMLSISNRFSNYLDSHTISSSFHITLKKCIDKYDETRGAKFTSCFYQQFLYCLKNNLKSTQISRQREVNFRNGEIPIHHKKKDSGSRKRERRLGRDAQIILGIKDVVAEAKASRQVQLILRKSTKWMPKSMGKSSASGSIKLRNLVNFIITTRKAKNGNQPASLKMDNISKTVLMVMAGLIF